ncbi:MAG: tRNA pseudouridine(38-40) synthase TruA [Christensenellaceae bacterium]|nr:tRNA pseudouridine(38-40) synthase TruA [Christensenellaceae bacterium]
MRVKLIVEYDGTAYSGWPRQKNAPSVQQTLEEAFFTLTGEDVTMQGAGRTDAGVHAMGQTVHFDTNCTIPAEKICFAINTKLPPDIRVRSSAEAAPRFHATLDAKGKHYRYVIYNAKHANAILSRYSAHIYYALDEKKMQEAANALIGEHDFIAYSSTGSDIKTTVRRIFDIKVTRQGDYVVIDVFGNGFLYNMVRIISGTLADIGTGRLPVSTAKEALEKKDRTLAGQTMPAKGLTMMEVFYE